MIRRTVLIPAVVLALFTAVSARSDTTAPPNPPPGLEEVWPILTREEQESLSEIFDSTPLDTNAIADEMSGVPEGPTQAELDAVAAESAGLSRGLEQGIFEYSQSPFPERILAENQWVGLSADGRTLREAFAGASRGDVSQGLLVVRETPWPQPADVEYPGGEEVREYSGTNGPYHIVGANGVTLQLETTGGPLVFSLEHRVLDHPPECSSVRPDPSVIEAHDHELRRVILAGASDPDGDAVALTVTTVTQDEPLDGVGDGDTSPDAQRGQAPHEVLVRAERQGPGDGRVYRISFTGDDGKGGTCQGTVTVAVPHDRPDAVDSGLVVNSFGE